MMRPESHFLQKMKDQKGSMIILAYFVIVVFLGIGAAFVLLSVGEKNTAERQRLTTVAFHIAEGGLERALYDLRQDFVNDPGTPSWSDGDINGYAIGPDTSNYYSIPYSSTALNGGSYDVQLRNVSGTDDIWIRSVGTINDVDHTIEIYVKMVNLSPWDNAIFAGAGASGTMVNGNVDIRGSVHVLGSGLSAGDFAIDLGGTAELVGNNYNGLDAGLVPKVPALPTTIYNGETVETLNAELRVKKGMVGLSGSASVGETDVFGNSTKETVNGVYVTDGFGGSQGTANVNSDNGVTASYDLGDTVDFPSLSDPYPGYATYMDYLKDNAHVVSDPTDLGNLANINPASNFTISGANGSITMDGSGNMTVDGIVFVEGGDVNFLKDGSNKNINYTGTGSLVVTGNVQVNVNLGTTGNNSFPNNIVGIMTPNNISFNEANTNAMGVFYGENQISVAKQTDIMGTIVSNYFDMGTNVPSIYQVPEVVNYLPPGLIGSNSVWYLVVAWIKS